PTLEESAECVEAMARMNKEYVPPTEADILWADAIVLGTPLRFNASSAEWASYLELLGKLRSAGKLEGKVATAFISTPDGQPARASFATTILELGLIVVPAASHSTGTPVNPVDEAVTQGRKVAAIASALKV